MAERATVTLEGGCDCGRNRYVVQVASSQATELLKIRFDRSSISLREHSFPASVFLRVPLSAMHSTTYAYYPDETHAHIRRSYVSQRLPNSKRFFCGICSELLSVWTEDESEADHINVNWHTLERESKETVDGFGVLPDRRSHRREVSQAQSDVSSPVRASPEYDEVEEVMLMGTVGEAADPPVGLIELRTRSQPWYEEILQGSALGHLRKRKGVGFSPDGSAQVEWEVVEYISNEGHDDAGGLPTPKRQQISKDDDNDAPMGGVH